jgi:hypothetical protein
MHARIIDFRSWIPPKWFVSFSLTSLFFDPATNIPDQVFLDLDSLSSPLFFSFLFTSSYRYLRIWPISRGDDSVHDQPTKEIDQPESIHTEFHPPESARFVPSPTSPQFLTPRKSHPLFLDDRRSSFCDFNIALNFQFSHSLVLIHFILLTDIESVEVQITLKSQDFSVEQRFGK